MVKVCILTYYSFSDVQGGAPLYTYHIAKHLVEKGFDVTVFCRGRRRENVEFDYNGIKVKQYGKLQFNYTKYHRIIDRNIFYIWEIWTDFLKECRTADVIHIISSNFFFPLGYRCRKKRLITTVIEDVLHKERTLMGNLFLGYQRWQLEMALKYSDYVTIINEQYQEYIKEKYPCFLEKTKLIQNFVETNIFIPSVDAASLGEAYVRDKIILSAGSLTTNKAFDIAIKAFKKVTKEHPISIMLIAGNGPLRNNLQKLAKNIGMDTYIKFLGELNHYEAMPKYYALADIVVVPSRSEGGQPPFVVLEPMAMGKPVIISEASDIKGILGDSVIRFKIDDVEDLASKIIYLLENQDVAKEIGKKNRKKILERYSLKNFFKAYDEIYTSL